MCCIQFVLTMLRVLIFSGAAWGAEDALRPASVQTAVVDAGPLYRERYRQQFHLTARNNWLNDPNGLIFYKGEYHLFFQHNPKGNRWGNMTWDRAVSPDRVHGTQSDHALPPDANGVCFSGSAVIGWNNTAGFQVGEEKPIVAIYTSHGKKETQSPAYSNDKGRTCKKYEGNPVLLDQDREGRSITASGQAPGESSARCRRSSPTARRCLLHENTKGA